MSCIFPGFLFQAEGSLCVVMVVGMLLFFFFFQAEDGIRDSSVTGVQTCALPISAFLREGAFQVPVLFPEMHPLVRKLFTSKFLHIEPRSSDAAKNQDLPDQTQSDRKSVV